MACDNVRIPNLALKFYLFKKNNQILMAKAPPRDHENINKTQFSIFNSLISIFIQ
jgi:hypothetical protein